ncbi:hypothetical protein SCP_1801170 [Sparassis crispa]|uniref:Uncharacterized protein n=1 Tax=Sparassis crispa TaxID=139825 RepID=A0A401H6T4_9APHY|nr:hypothetical protein SCP_1801170 [Sparassis crispa]GBE90093.1 hypothetical protein SCP_1801170 [Sparassis crispa]
MTPNDLVTAIPSILEGQTRPSPGDVLILTAVLSFNLDGDCMARWVLGKKRLERMRNERWMMVAYRADMRLPFTHPALASEWKEAAALA